MTLPLLVLLLARAPACMPQAPAAAAVEQDKPSAPGPLGELETFTARNPDDPKGWVLLGLAYWDRNEYPRALYAPHPRTGGVSARREGRSGIR